MHIYIDDQELFRFANFRLLKNAQFTNNPKEADVLCVGITKIIDDQYMVPFENVKIILSPSTAIDHIRISKDVKIIRLIPDEISYITASSEFALFLIMSLLRNAKQVLNEKIAEASDVDGKIIGILGHGRIGKHLEKYLTALNATVIWHDTAQEGYSKQYVLENSAVIVIAVSATEDNNHYIDKKDFSIMKQCPYFVNISRGFIVNEDDLIYALEHKQIAGMALDVVTDRSKFNGYASWDNVILTSHIAGTTLESHKKACDFVIRKLYQKSLF